MEINYNETITVTILFLIVFLTYILYKHENKLMINILSLFCGKSKPKELEKDNRFQDWIVLILLLILIVAMGVKLITFSVVISDSMKPEFERGDMF